MACTHLGLGKDVIWPQVASRAHEVEGLEEAAREAGGDYCEFMLTIDKEDSLARLTARSSSERVAGIQRDIDSFQTRPSCILINPAGMTPQQTYAKLEEELAARR